MKIILLFFATVLTLTLSVKDTYAQGCSDAGLCSFNLAEADSATYIEPRFTFGLSNTTGVGDESVLINSTGVEFGVNYSDFGFIAKIPFTFTTGTLGQTNGLGDLTMLVSSKLYSTEDFGLSILGGVKIATNNADLLNEDGRSLPMVYQTSNGTNDVLFLLAANIDNWVISTGVQIPLNRNENSFEDRSALYDPGPNPSQYFLEWQNYQSSRNFKRGNDVMLKIEKYFIIEDDLNFMAGVLPVYRLSESIYENSSREDVTIMNTDGLTLNIIAGLNYKVTEKHTFGLNIGFPVVTREIRADGLTRALVVSADFKFEL